MPKRTLIVLTMVVAMIVAIEPVQTVHGVLLTMEEAVALDAMSTLAANGDKAASQNNSFARAIGAPFRAIGRLFGKGKKDSNKLERISEKDAKRFESGPPVQHSKTAPATVVSSSSNAPESQGMMTTANQSATEALSASAADHLEKGRDLLNSHDLNGAIGELSLAASADPKLSEASTLLGVAYWRKGLRDLAIRSFETAVRTQKDDAQNLNNLGFVLYENGDYESASKYLKRAAKLAPNDPRIWNNLGLAQSERGHFDDAFESFARAQGEFKGHLNVAARLEQRGSTKKAIKHLEKAIALQPNSPDVLAKLAQLYDNTGNEQQAQSARSSLQILRTTANATLK
jgi:Tfp pilus assembly protein PilF